MTVLGRRHSSVPASFWRRFALVASFFHHSGVITVIPPQFQRHSAVIPASLWRHSGVIPALFRRLASFWLPRGALGVAPGVFRPSKELSGSPRSRTSIWVLPGVFGSFGSSQEPLGRPRTQFRQDGHSGVVPASFFQTRRPSHPQLHGSPHVRIIIFPVSE